MLYVRADFYSMYSFSNSLYLIKPFYSLRISNEEIMGQSNSAYVVDTLDGIEELENSSSSSSRSPSLQVTLHLALYFFVICGSILASC